MDGKVIMGLDDYNGLQNHINNLKNQLNNADKFFDKFYKLADIFIEQELTSQITAYYVKNYELDDLLDEKKYILKDEYNRCTQNGIDIDYCKKKVIEKYNEVKENEKNDK